MEWFEVLENGLANIVMLGEFLLEAISVFCVLAGVFKTVLLAIQLRYRYHHNIPFVQLRISFGIWLALALEFQLGADILATTIAPSLERLAELALITVIRTFLNYFLNKELQEQYELQEKSKEHPIENPIAEA